MMKENKTVVENILLTNKTITSQLKALYRNRHIPEVQDYIDMVCKSSACTEYVKYLIDKYYYNKVNLVKPKKTGLECWGKIILVYENTNPNIKLDQ